MYTSLASCCILHIYSTFANDLHGYSKLDDMPRKYTPSLFKKSNFSEKFFPARPSEFWTKARSRVQSQIDAAQRIGTASAANKAYVRWLRKESMLHNAEQTALAYSGKGSMWQNQFAKPRPRTAVGLTSVWYTAYPASLITKPNESILGALGNEDFWDILQEIGIDGIHTGPMKIAGGLKGWNFTPSIDGHFDRISNRIDPIFGTEAEFRRMSKTANRHGGTVIDDIIPGHTGKGADFRLAEMGYDDYPGIYHMVEIDEADWRLLPQVPAGVDSVNINPTTEEELKKRGYIVGKLQRTIFYEPGVKETNWSATRVIKGVDNIKRRWVYLHYWKDGQPSINWLDPSFAGVKLVVGDALHSLGQLGSRALRLDANGFLGIEKGDDDKPAWSEGHPLSGAANQVISGIVRKMGGFTFQELNLAVEDIKTMSEAGADLSYDFINRPAYHHALVTEDTEFLRLTMRLAIDSGIEPVSLVHALQNHDELTTELIHFWTLHKDDLYTYHKKELKGTELRDLVRKNLSDKLTGEGASYNLPFTSNGIASTTASVIAASLGISDLDHISQPETETIKKAHLLLAMYNALQPGVFALSGWDLSGALPLKPEQIPELLRDGDTRWANRGAHDLMGSDPGAKRSFVGIPRARCLYGPLPEQLADPNSFVSKLKNILSIREKYNIAAAYQIDIPDTDSKGVLTMVHSLSAEGSLQVTVLNFSNKEVVTHVTSKRLSPGASVTDMFSEQVIAAVDDLHSFTIPLGSHEGTSLLIKSQTLVN